jgi:hypothetical protein
VSAVAPHSACCASLLVKLLAASQRVPDGVNGTISGLCDQQQQLLLLLLMMTI